MYRKPTHTDLILYTHYSSHHHSSVKSGTVRCLGRRAEMICDDTSRKEELAHLRNTSEEMAIQRKSSITAWEDHLGHQSLQRKKIHPPQSRPNCYICHTSRACQRGSREHDWGASSLQIKWHPQTATNEGEEFHSRAEQGGCLRDPMPRLWLCLHRRDWQIIGKETNRTQVYAVKTEDQKNGVEVHASTEWTGKEQRS